MPSRIGLDHADPSPAPGLDDDPPAGLGDTSTLPGSESSAGVRDALDGLGKVARRDRLGAATTLRRLGRYIVLDVLGQGGMGVVFKGYDDELDRQVALKVLHPDRTGRHGPRLEREAQALAKLAHPNVVQVFEVGETEGQLFVAMELVKGQTLERWQSEPDEPRGWKECVAVYLQAGRGLAAAHAKGLVHRDFKPGNAILDDEGRTRVLDFGLVRRSDDVDERASVVERVRTDLQRTEPLDASLTRTGTVLGTPAYMPLEQMGGGEADARSDQFSFCVSLYEAVYGERPFEGITVTTLMTAMADGTVRPIPRGSRVPVALRRVLLRGLAADPAERWPSMDELLERLQRLVAPRARRRLAVLGLVLAAVASVWAIRQGGVISEQEEQLTDKEVQLHQKVVELSQQLAAQKGLRAKDIAEDEGRELEAVRIAVEAFEGLDSDDPEIPPPLFEGLTYALAGIDRGIALRGHTDRVAAVALSPDGRTIATASYDQTVRLWDAGSGAPVLTIEGHHGAVHAVAWSPDSDRLATACDDGTARIWDTAAGDELESFPHDGSVRDVAFSPDGQALATAHGDMALVWRRDSDALVVPLVGHTGRVRSLAWSPDGARVVTTSEDHTARLWVAETGTTALILEGHGDWVLDAAVSPDGSHVATGGRDDTARLWDTSTGQQTASFEPGEVVYAVAFSPDSTRLATGTFDDGVTRLWDVASGAPLEAFRHDDAVVDVAFSPDGDQLVTASWDTTARSWNLDRGRALMTLPHPRRVDTVAVSPDGTRVATGSGDGGVRVWDARSGAHLVTLHGHGIDILAVAFSPDGSRLATASWDGTARVWDMTTSTSLYVLTGHTEPVRAVAFSPDGRRLATASRDGTARTWDAADGELLYSMSHTGPLLDAVFAPDGQQLWTVGADGAARVWSIATGEGLSGSPQEDPVDAVAFSPDGTRIAVATRDHVVHVRHADSGEAVATFPGHSATVVSMAFSPDGARLASASEDWTARVWDLASEDSDATLPHEGPVLDLAWSIDGEFLATAAGDEEARLWTLEPREWLTWGCAVLDRREGHEQATHEACSRGTTPAIEMEPTTPPAQPAVTTAEDVDYPEVVMVHGVELVLIPGGTFGMGSPPVERGRFDREGPQHEVTLDSFYLARTEVTNAQYASFLEATPDATTMDHYWKDERFNQPDQPVTGLSWHDARAYCDWAGLVLPTEAQWEYAARAGTNTAYWFGNDAKDLDRFDWYLDNTEGGALLGRAHSVGTKGANPFGLHDVHGNMREWTLDAYAGYSTRPRPGDGLRRDPTSGPYRVVRSSGWDDSARLARSAHRNAAPPDYRLIILGFRPALQPRKVEESSG